MSADHRRVLPGAADRCALEIAIALAASVDDGTIDLRHEPYLQRKLAEFRLAFEVETAADVGR